MTPRVDLCPLVVTAKQASENERWRGVRHQNPTVQCSTAARSPARNETRRRNAVLPSRRRHPIRPSRNDRVNGTVSAIPDRRRRPVWTCSATRKADCFTSTGIDAASSVTARPTASRNSPRAESSRPPAEAAADPDRDRNVEAAPLQRSASSYSSGTAGGYRVTNYSLLCRIAVTPMVSKSRDAYQGSGGTSLMQQVADGRQEVIHECSTRSEDMGLPGAGRPGGSVGVAGQAGSTEFLYVAISFTRARGTATAAATVGACACNCSMSAR